MPAPTFRLFVALCGALLAASSAVPAAAGPPSTTTAPTTTTTEAPPPSTTTTTTTAAPDGGSTTTTSPDATTTTTTSPEGSTTTTTLEPDPEDPVGHADAPADEVPVSDVTVPPREDEDENASVYGQEASRVIKRQLRVARASAVQTQAAFEAATTRLADARDKLQSVESRISSLSRTQRLAVVQLRAAERQFEERVADAFVRGNSADLATILEAVDANDLTLRTELTSSVLENDIDSVVEYLAAREAVDSSLLAMVGDLEASREAYAGAQSEYAALESLNNEAQFQLAVFAAGSEIVISGFVFPVGDPHTFGDSFGAPRMLGTEYEHAHEGTDILAPFGTELYATERGVITRVGSDVLGGLKLWVKGESGTYYYYAHLQSIAPGIGEGTLVAAGDVVGFVGDSGNAKGGPPHLHFEVHPGGGPSVNPYPLLRVVDDLRKLAEDS